MVAARELHGTSGSTEHSLIMLLEMTPSWAAKQIQHHAKLLQSCPTLCDPMDYSWPDSSVCGVLQAKILEWVAVSSSRGSS